MVARLPIKPYDVVTKLECKEHKAQKEVKKLQNIQSKNDVRSSKKDDYCVY